MKVRLSLPCDDHTDLSPLCFSNVNDAVVILISWNLHKQRRIQVWGSFGSLLDKLGDPAN